jgi:hypothetical protein
LRVSCCTRALLVSLVMLVVASTTCPQPCTGACKRRHCADACLPSIVRTAEAVDAAAAQALLPGLCEPRLAASCVWAPPRRGRNFKADSALQMRGIPPRHLHRAALRMHSARSAAACMHDMHACYRCAAARGSAFASGGHCGCAAASARPVASMRQACSRAGRRMRPASTRRRMPARAGARACRCERHHCGHMRRCCGRARRAC